MTTAAMTLRRALVLCGAVVLAVLGCWAGYHFGVFGGRVALRLGAGLCAGAVLAAAVPVAWPLPRGRGSLERAVTSLPAGEHERPASLREVELAVAMASSKAGGHDLRFRLAPILQEVAVQQLQSRRSVDVERSPGAARELLGDALWELVGAKGPPGNDRGGPGIALEDLAAYVSLLEAL